MTKKDTQAVAMFDLTKNDLGAIAEVGYEFNLALPTGEPTSVYITVLGDMSPTVKNFHRKRFAEMKAQEQAFRRRNPHKEMEMSLDEAEEFAVEAAAIRVKAWRGLGEGGVAVDCTPENVRRVLKQHTWIREQIQTEASELLNFRPE